MSTLLTFSWSAEPDIFSLGPLTVRWYGLLWVLAFALGIFILQRLFKKDNVKPEWVDSVFMYVFIGTVIGARLGHVFFYGWEYYSKNLIDIFKIWEGGLASHGASVGILVSIWLFSKFVSKKSMIWALDRIVIPVAIGGAFVRMGNFINSEIIGMPTDLSIGVIFTHIDNIPRHPAQIYEALSYTLLFVLLLFLFFRTDIRKKEGYIFGIFLIILFASRFFIEFVKENQEAFESGMVLNMGQWLSIPFILAGVFFTSRAYLNKKQG